jgi:hypothetical protein
VSLTALRQYLIRDSSELDEFMKREEEREQLSGVLSSNKQSSQFGSLTSSGSDNVSNIPLQTYQTGYRYLFVHVNYNELTRVNCRPPPLNPNKREGGDFDYFTTLAARELYGKLKVDPLINVWTERMRLVRIKRRSLRTKGADICVQWLSQKVLQPLVSQITKIEVETG